VSYSFSSRTPEQEVWDTHWDDFGGANQLNPAQEYRRCVVLPLLERPTVPKRLLDVGSGSGEFLVSASVRWPAAELLGLELSAAAVEQAQTKAPRATFHTVDLLGEPVPEEGEELWATHAVCSEVLEHVDDPVRLLRNARRWFAPGCRVVITVPGGPMSAFDRHTGHRRHFAPEELWEVMSAAGLDDPRTSATGFPFFNLYRGLVIVSGRKLIDAAKPAAQRAPGGLALRAGTAVFRALFRLNLPRSRFGWQIVGVGREPERPARSS
jgi:SAM-dependent methyltransferase